MKRGLIYSINTALGFFKTNIGAILAILAALWSHWFSGASSYRPLFAPVGILALINLVLILSIEEYRRAGSGFFGAINQRDPGLHIAFLQVKKFHP